MRMAMTPELEDLKRIAAGILGRPGAIPAHEVPETLGLLAQLLAELLRPSGVPAASPVLSSVDPPTCEGDVLLTADEVAAQLQRSRAWVYRQARLWPFANKLSHKTLRFSKRGMEKWMQRSQVARAAPPRHD